MTLQYWFANCLCAWFSTPPNIFLIVCFISKYTLFTSCIQWLSAIHDICLGNHISWFIIDEAEDFPHRKLLFLSAVDWLPNKAIETSLPCYSTHRWGEGRDSYISQGYWRVRKYNKTELEFELGSPSSLLTICRMQNNRNFGLKKQQKIKENLVKN